MVDDPPSSLSGMTLEQRYTMAAYEGFRDLEQRGALDVIRKVLRSQVGDSVLAQRRRSFRLARALAPVCDIPADDHNLAAWIAELFLPASLELGTGERLTLVARKFLHLAFWARDGFPTIHLTGKQAAALSLSDISPEVLAALRPEWRALEVTLAEPWRLGDDHATSLELSIQAHGERREDVGLETWLEGAHWLVFVNLASGQQLSQTAPLNALYELSAIRISEESYLEVTQADTTMLMLMIRLALNVAVALQHEGGLTALRRRHRPPSAAGTSSSASKAQQKRRRRAIAGRKGKGRGGRISQEPPRLQLELSVALDLREHVAACISGQQRHFTKAAWPVRGHWKHQPYGPERSLRRLIYIAPHMARRRALKGTTTAT